MYEIPETQCPACGARFDAVTAVRYESMPEPGDLSVCIMCASVLRFGNDLSYELPDRAERRKLLNEVPMLQQAVDAAVRAREHKAKLN